LCSWPHTWATACCCILAIHVHEDDASALCGRAGVDRSGRQATQRRAVLRIGVATGAGRRRRSRRLREAQERGAIGETLNLAARLQGIAEPNVVMIADSTRSRLLCAVTRRFSPPSMPGHTARFGARASIKAQIAGSETVCFKRQMCDGRSRPGHAARSQAWLEGRRASGEDTKCHEKPRLVSAVWSAR
jgi:hypothetical protein